MNTPRTVLGRIEIAKLLEVDTRTPHAWLARGLMPPPDHECVNGGPAWDRSTILAWAVKTGRLPDSLCIEGAQYGTAPTRRGGQLVKKMVQEQYA